MYQVHVHTLTHSHTTTIQRQTKYKEKQFTKYIPPKTHRVRTFPKKKSFSLRVSLARVVRLLNLTAGPTKNKIYIFFLFFFWHTHTHTRSRTQAISVWQTINCNLFHQNATNETKKKKLVEKNKKKFCPNHKTIKLKMCKLFAQKNYCPGLWNRGNVEL